MSQIENSGLEMPSPRMGRKCSNPVMLSSKRVMLRRVPTLPTTTLSSTSGILSRSPFHASGVLTTLSAGQLPPPGVIRYSFQPVGLPQGQGIVSPVVPIPRPRPALIPIFEAMGTPQNPIIIDSGLRSPPGGPITATPAPLPLYTRLSPPFSLPHCYGIHPYGTAMAAPTRPTTTTTSMRVIKSEPVTSSSMQQVMPAPAIPPITMTTIRRRPNFGRIHPKKYWMALWRQECAAAQVAGAIAAERAAAANRI